MNAKKIWLLAIIFGLVMSVTFFILTSKSGNTTTENVAANQDKVEAAEQEAEVKDSLDIESGKRAISIAVDEVQSVSGFVQPGSFVDIVAVSGLQAESEKTARIILENIKVLAVGKTRVAEEGENQDPYKMVTLEVSTAEGMSIALEKEKGVVTLMLRGKDNE